MATKEKKPIYKLGKKPAVKDSVSLRFRDYVALTKLPEPPETVNHQHILHDWGMLGNDKYGDCVWAGAGHETKAWNITGGHPADITDTTVLEAYSAVTGFNPDDPSTDNGTDMSVAAKYRQKTGVADALGMRHKIGAYVAVTPGSHEEVKQGVWLFESIGIGIQFPNTAMDQFNDGKPWDVVKGAKIEGGHYVPALGYDNDYIYVITWGKVQKMTWAFFDKYCDEAICYISLEMLKGEKSVEGFTAKQLQDDLKAL